MEDNKIADELLHEWHDWSSQYRPALGMPGCAPSCREASTSRQWDSNADLNDNCIRTKEMEAVEWCVDAVPIGCRQAIGAEMKNRAARAKVWRSPGKESYVEALETILPVMKKRGLI